MSGIRSLVTTPAPAHQLRTAVTIAATATHVIVGENPRPRTTRLRSAGLASWSDDDSTGLELHEPEATDIVITFESRH